MAEKTLTETSAVVKKYIHSLIQNGVKEIKNVNTLANKSGVSQSYLSDFLNPAKAIDIGAKNLEKLAKTYGFSTGKFLVEAEEHCKKKLYSLTRLSKMADTLLISMSPDDTFNLAVAMAHSKNIDSELPDWVNDQTIFEQMFAERIALFWERTDTGGWQRKDRASDAFLTHAVECLQDGIQEIESECATLEECVTSNGTLTTEKKGGFMDYLQTVDRMTATVKTITKEAVRVVQILASTEIGVAYLQEKNAEELEKERARAMRDANAELA